MIRPTTKDIGRWFRWIESLNTRAKIVSVDELAGIYFMMEGATIPQGPFASGDRVLSEVVWLEWCDDPSATEPETELARLRAVEAEHELLRAAAKVLVAKITCEGLDGDCIDEAVDALVELLE